MDLNSAAVSEAPAHRAVAPLAGDPVLKVSSEGDLYENVLTSNIPSGRGCGLTHSIPWTLTMENLGACEFFMSLAMNV